MSQQKAYKKLPINKIDAKILKQPNKNYQIVMLLLYNELEYPLYFLIYFGYKKILTNGSFDDIKHKRSKDQLIM